MNNIALSVAHANGRFEERSLGKPVSVKCIEIISNALEMDGISQIRIDTIKQAIRSERPVNRKMMNLKSISSLLDVSTRTLMRWIEDGKFPQPIRFSSNCHRWREDVVLAWCDDNRIYNLGELEEFVSNETLDIGLVPSPNGIYTYLMYTGFSGVYKIGRTNNIKSRYKTLSSSNPNITIIATCKVDIENALHKYYSAKRIDERELFTLSNNDVTNISSKMDDINSKYATKF